MNYKSIKSVNDKLFLSEQNPGNVASSEYNFDHYCNFNENCAPAASNANARARLSCTRDTL